MPVVLHQEMKTLPPPRFTNSSGCEEEEEESLYS
jgi:hypothetical protein